VLNYKEYKFDKKCVYTTEEVEALAEFAEKSGLSEYLKTTI